MKITTKYTTLLVFSLAMAGFGVVAHHREWMVVQAVLFAVAFVCVCRALRTAVTYRADMIRPVVPLVFRQRVVTIIGMGGVLSGRQPLCDAEQGVMTVEMISAVFASHEQQGRAVSIPLEKRSQSFA